MDIIRMIRISFWSFIRVCAAAWLCFGFGFGVVSFVISLIAPDRVWVNFFETSATLSGINAGLVGLVVWPLVCAVFGVIFGVIAYFPFNLFLKIVRGLKIIFL